MHTAIAKAEVRMKDVEVYGAARARRHRGRRQAMNGWKRDFESADIHRSRVSWVYQCWVGVLDICRLVGWEEVAWLMSRVLLSSL